MHDIGMLQAGVAANDPQVIKQVIELLDKGVLRVAQPAPNPAAPWIVHAWIKQAILTYFRQQELTEQSSGPLHFHDKIPVKSDLAEAGIRVVPPGTVRFGAHVERGAIIMPAYVNIGAYVGSGTMVDTWATVGSCAQIGKNVHLSGGVGIGGVLEPASAQPVIVEDNAFIGSRCVLVEGVRVGPGAVLGAGVVLTASTPILDVTGSTERAYKGFVPANSVVISGSRPKKFPAGEYHVPCALIIGQRKASTDLKTSLNAALREHDVSV